MARAQIILNQTFLVLLPGPSERSIHLAKIEVKRVVKEEMIRLVSVIKPTE